MLQAAVRLEITTLALLAPSSDQLSYRALFEENVKSSQLRGWKNSENKFDRQKGQIKKRISINFILFLDKHCIGLVMILSCSS